MATILHPGNVSGLLNGGALVSDTYVPSPKVPFAVRARGSFTANVRLQESRDNGASWDELYVFSAPGFLNVTPIGAPLYRLNMSGTGDFTSGSVGIFIGQ
jgi:hypothetical protein